MKKTLFILNFVIVSLIYGQENGFNYKALLSENGNVYANQTVVVKFSLLDQEGMAFYEEIQETITDANGILSVSIGEGDAVSGDFSTIDWGDASYFLKVEIDMGNGFEDFGTTAFKYVPYAKYAEKSGDAFSGDYNDLTNTPDFTDWDTDVTDDVTELNDLSDAYTSSSIVSIGTIMPTSLINSVNIGIDALPNVTSGSTNVAVGYRSLYKTTYSMYNTAIGSWALSELLSGAQNTAIGIGAMGVTVSGENNTVVGFDAARAEEMGNNNVMLGYHSGYNTAGDGNILIGYEAGYNETGSNKLYIENSNSENPLIGGDFSTDEVVINGSLIINDGTQGDGKIFVSDTDGKGTWQSLSFVQGARSIDELSDARYEDHSLYLGLDAGVNDDVSDNRNTGVGYGVLNSVVNGTSNVAIGFESQFANVSGYDNVSIGDRALYQNTSNGNIALGFNTLFENVDGNGNVAIGRNAGKNNLGDGNIFIGYEAGLDETGSNKLYIDNSSTSEPLIGGDFSTDQVTINGDMKVTRKLTATDSGSADMKAYIYGYVNASASIETASSSDGFTATYVTTGKYRIDFDNESGTSIDNYIVVASITYGFQGFISTVIYTDYFEVRIEDKDGTPADKPFTFVVYKK